MSNIGNTNSANSVLFNQIETSFKNDNRIDKKELNTLKELISNSTLEGPVKEGVINLLENAKKASDGFLWIFGRDISAKELSGLNQQLGQLKELANASGDSSLAKSLCSVIENSLPKSSLNTQENSSVSSHKLSDFNPVSNFFSKLFSPGTKSQSTANQDGSVARNDISSFHLTQYTGAASQGGDCGPTSGAMILNAFGINASVSDVRNSAPGKPRSAPWALTENQISDSVEKLGNGAVKQVGGTERYSPNDNSQMINDIRSQLQEGKLLMLCTGVKDPNWDSRHYIVVTGIDNNGNIQVSDPAQPAGSSGYYITPEELSLRMSNADDLRGANSTTITAFQRNA